MTNYSKIKGGFIMSASKAMYQKLAKLAVVRGVNVQPNQPLVITASVRDYEFVRMVAKEAYAVGAREVIVNWIDTELGKLNYTYQSEEALTDIPDWKYDMVKREHDLGACYLRINSDMPGALKDVDQSKVRAYQMAYSKKMKDLRKYTMNNEGQWCVIGIPSVEWAKVVFPELSEEEAFEKLEDAIFMTSRVTEDSDPLENWRIHDANLVEHARKLTELNFKQLHFTSELGTDLTVELVDNHVWIGGGDKTPKGVYFDPNIPTEECFTMPKKTGVNGIVYASKPLSYSGKVIDGFWFRFENGKVVDFGAKQEEEILKSLLDFDEGSRYLGEVALVPYDSPISNSNILFFNTLFDENAACHLALGMPYPENVKGGANMSEEELKASGANESSQHEDFMFGTKEMNIDGIQQDGTVVPVFRNGNFVI